MTIGEVDIESVKRLSRDLITAIKDKTLVMTRGDIRYLVDVYYQLQEFRKAAYSQEGAADAQAEPKNLVEWMAQQLEILEGQVRRALDAWTSTDPVSKWAKSIHGIGPVLSAGLSAHIDIERAPTVGHIWSFAGLNPKMVWEKGQKRPYNARLKVLCWKIGDSFVKQHNNPKCAYGRVYAERKALEVSRNDGGLLKEQAAATLEAKKITDKATRARYEEGRLPDGRIDLRARRYAVKLFLSHWHDVSYRERYGVAPPLPYPIAHLGHAHVIRAEDMK